MHLSELLRYAKQNWFALQGTKVKEARELIRTSGLKILARDDLDKAADLAVHLAQIVKLAREMKMDVNFEIPDAQK